MTDEMDDNEKTRTTTTKHEKVGEIVTELGMTMYPSYARFEWYIETSCCSKRSVGCYIHEMILDATPHYH